MNLSAPFFSAVSPTDRRPIHEWARCLTLPPVLTIQGHFSADRSRHFLGPLDALKEDAVREINIRAPVRSGKTLIADVAAPWAVRHDNASVLRLFSDDTQAKEHAELRGWPMLESSPEIASMLQSDRHKSRTQEIIFSNGLPLFFKGPAIGNLQAKGWKWVICDEPWLYKPGILGQAKARLGDFVRMSNSKFLCISQGGEEETDWSTQDDSGSKHEWNVACLGCGKMFAPIWSGHRADGSRWGAVFDAVKLERGNGYNIAKACETIRVECPHCAHPHLDNEVTRAAWNASGIFACDTTPGPVRSFHWTALIDYPWTALVQQWLAARTAAHSGNLLPTIEFFQKRLAEHKSERTAHEGHQSFARIEIESEDPKAKLWEGEAARFLTVDRQAEDVYWATARAWAKGTGESRRLCFRKLYSPSDIEAVREEFAIPKNRVLIDSGYRPKGDQGVYADCIRYGWIALKGADEPYFWHSGKVGLHEGCRVQKFYSPITWGEPEHGRLRSRKAPLIRFAASAASDKVQTLIENRLWVEPTDRDDDMEREYKAQMAAEFKRRRTNQFTGRTEWVWVCPSGNNHAFDCAKMQVTGAWLMGLL